VAELERDMVSERTRAAMAEARRQGKVLGRPVIIDDDVTDRILALRTAGTSYPKICQALEVAAVDPPSGLRWYPSTVARVCKRRHVS
jgi:DNA invertase Pin-like site-specific DNA recombinase